LRKNGVINFHTMTDFNQDQLLIIAHAIADPTLIVGSDFVVVANNNAAAEFFGPELNGKHLTSHVRAPAVLDAVKEATTVSKTSSTQLLLRTPVPRNYDVLISPLGANLALIMLRDQTYEQQIERMRSDFVANASHELRTPLASLTGFIETMQGAAKNDAAAKETFLKLMKAQADRMAQLIDDLLSLSRIEISEHVPPTETTDLKHITNQACDLLKTVAQNFNCELQLNLPLSMPVVGDAGQLSQVVHNVIENAIKYAGQNKSVKITGSIENKKVNLSIQDFGPGIAAHHVPRLTERFYRVNVQDSRNRGGTGLGLAIAKHILNRHRGKLSVESELGTGSIFSIQLPEAI
jgi:two-component system, OmpR family, phosphate regulon sensor histidine kinase PhoR